MKSNYWSHSKFADWLRGATKFPSGTPDAIEEWKKWKKNAAKQKPFRYWLAEKGLDYLQDIVFSPVNGMRSLIIYINNRWFTKTHSLDSRLKRGRWYHFDTRLLHAAFEGLVNFVEIEQAWMQVISSKEEAKKWQLPWYLRLFTIGIWRCPEAGIAHLKWASKLKMDEDVEEIDNLDLGKLAPQAIAAQETLLLYKWWKEERPRRANPYEACGLSDYWREKAAQKNNMEDFFSSLIEDDKEGYKNFADRYQQIKEQQEEEDNAMLVRLAKIRPFLWSDF